MSLDLKELERKLDKALSKETTESLTEFLNQERIKSGVPDYIYNCPLTSDWCEYKGEIYFGMLNYQQSIESKRVMIDLSYCATQGLNGIIIKTVQWNESKFNLNPKHTN